MLGVSSDFAYNGRSHSANSPPHPPLSTTSHPHPTQPHLTHPPPPTPPSKPLVREAIKILDAYIADAWRQQAAATYGAALAERLLPRQPHERADRDRAQLLIDTLTARLASPPPRGSGPMGTLTPAEAASFLTETRERAMATFPRLDRVLRSPGAVEAINELSTGLASRGAARFVKLLMQGMDPAVQERMAQGVGVGAAGEDE